MINQVFKLSMCIVVTVAMVTGIPVTILVLIIHLIA